LRTQNVTRRRRGGRVRLGAFIAVGAIVGICLLAIVIDSALYYNKVHAGVSVAGTSLGGLTRDEATATLTKLVEEAQSSPITLTSDEKTWDIMPGDVGATMDVSGAVSAAMEVSRESNFLADLGRRLNLYFNDVDLPLVGSVDEAPLDETVAQLAKEIDVPAVNAALSMENGKIKVVEDRTGRALDQDALRERLKAVLVTLHSTEIEMPIIITEPDVKAEDHRAAQEQAETMIGAPVVLTKGDQRWTVTGQQIATYLDFTSEMQNGVSTLVPYLSAEKMTPFLDSIAPSVVTKPVDATFKSDGKKAWVVPGAPGTVLDAEKTAAALMAASLKTTGRTIEVSVKTTDPDLTTEEAEAMGLKDLLASYTTPPYAGSANRQVNVRITTQYASDVMLAPGEVYNFDKQIGPRTAARGYLTAPGIVGPGKLEDVFGGGICQVSTTLFNAVFFAGLEVVERRNHSIYIDHYPKGRDATVSAGGPNLRFRNDTSHYIWIRGNSDGITTTFNIYGTSEGRKVSYTTSDFYNVVGRTQVTVTNPSLGPGTSVVKIGGQSGKQCKVVRTVTLPDGSVVHKDTFISTYPMVPRQIEVGTGTTTTTLPASTTTTTEAETTTTTTTTDPDISF